MPFYINYVINDIKCDYTTLVTGKTNVEKAMFTSVLEKADVVTIIQHQFWQNRESIFFLHQF